MPTENRRVATYLPKEIDDRLKAFIADRNLKGDSPALITILSEYFGVSYQVAHQVAHPDTFVTRQEFEALKVSFEGELLSELLSRVESIESRLACIDASKKKPSPPQVEEKPTYLKPSSDRKVWGTGDLAKRLGMNSTTLSHWKGSDPKRGKLPDELLKATRAKDPDGIGWIFDHEAKGFKPEREIPSSLPSELKSEPLPLDLNFA